MHPSTPLHSMVIAFLAASPAPADTDEPGQDAPWSPIVARGHLERIDEHASPADPLMGPPVTLPPTGQVGARRGGSPLTHAIQVNTNAQGLDIVGDAANEPSLAIDATAPNRIVIGWRQFNSISNSFRRAGYAYSNDGGLTWTAPTPLDNATFRSDPVLTYDAHGSILYSSLTVAGNVFSTDVFVSSDGGASWSAPMFSYGGDKQWLTTDRTGGPGDGFVYQAWSTAGNNFFPAQFNRSTDGGCTWEEPTEIIGQPIWGTCDVGPDGTVYVAGWSQLLVGGPLILARSANAQIKGSVPEWAYSELNLGGGIAVSMGPNPGGLLGQLDVATDHSGTFTHANVYVVGSVIPAGGGADPLEVHFTRSTDGGASWSAPVRVNDDPPGTNAWQWFAAMDVAPNGRIDVVWYDTREDDDPSSPSRSAVYYAFSTDGGQTFSPNARATIPFDHFIGYPQQNKLGDYIDIISDNVGAHVAVATTWNGGQDVWYLRFNDYDCDGNGVPDPDDILAFPGRDCNDNGMLDSCEIAAGVLMDVNGNGAPDICDCDADVDASGQVAIPDIGYIIFRLGDSGTPGEVDGDANLDGVVSADDIAYVVFRLGASCATG